MKTIKAYTSITEDAWRWIINCYLKFKYQYAYYFFKYVTHKYINPNFCNLPDMYKINGVIYCPRRYWRILGLIYWITRD